MTKALAEELSEIPNLELYYKKERSHGAVVSFNIRGLDASDAGYILTNIVKLEPLGNLVYLSGLKQPFFKLENRGYVIKGVLGADKIRIGVAYNDREVLEKIINYIEKINMAIYN